MRIHTRLDRATIEMAARYAGAGFIRLEPFRSRKASHGYDVILSGSGRTGGQYGAVDGRTATWDEWGIFLAALFRRDAETTAGPYLCAAHFEWSTNNRYDELAQERQHARHAWRIEGVSVGGAYRVSKCECGAARREIMPGHTWAEISGEDLPRGMRAARQPEARPSVPATVSRSNDATGNTMSPLPAAEPWVPRRRRSVEAQAYPRTNENGATVWACCESSIGSICEHLRDL